MTDRPKWARAIVEFVGDTVLDDKYEFPKDGEDDEIHDAVEAAVHKVLCDHYGHRIEDDQCNIPAHRYCEWCGLLESTINEVTP